MKTDGEEEETRTPTSQLTLPPQSSASTNSATSPTKCCEEKRVPRTGLEPARLAAHAPETCASTNSATWAFDLQGRSLKLFFVQHVSGKRDSDPRPQPWQGCALPTELFPPIFLRNPNGFFRLFPASLSIADAKVMLFSELANFLAVFFQKKGHFIEKRLFLGL